ncbi:hypothetical protein HYH03_016142 [Edaphochlamys debaryana]|uniref:ethanolamine-phosphate cytidylyltransferase n=1 Tax=Edaphochlamys debaryana TaxID=47281 RepID=A0A835XJ47_9CHLO|nr:hypothetical protein HYH03_016142 [Edaphochlamys debaryana]|eukprot:KAG2485043.1 hypothetical protein HYH03_016142 [Edaphochlamys debaryana]
MVLGVTFNSKDAIFWGCCAAAATATAGVITYYATKKYEEIVPIQYQYRPGTISGWLASALEKHSKTRRKMRPVRVYLDGCFDMMHYGHANALRQAKALGDELVVGLINDAEILRCKGPPVMNEEERHTLVDAVKWVDEILTEVPYDLKPEFVNDLFTKHRIDYIIHGDDPCLLPDGSDAYAHAKKLGRFKMVKRTEGVSTTDIVGRMLTCSRVNHFIKEDEPHPLASAFSMGREASGADASTSDDNTRTTLSKFLPTSRRLVQFSNGRVAPEGARIVYIDGAFDCFHPGHVKILKAAKAQGDFLLVGIHTDEEVQARRGPHLPIMNLHERSLSVLSCKYVDEVIIGAPCVMTDDLMTTFNISTVVRGSTSETSCLGPVEEERYAVPRKAGVFRELPSPSDMTARNVIQRIVAQREAFEKRNAKKVKGEEAYYQGAKTYVQEL